MVARSELKWNMDPRDREEAAGKVAEKALSPFSLRRRKGKIQREIALQYYLLNNLVERERERE